MILEIKDFKDLKEIERKIQTNENISIKFTRFSIIFLHDSRSREIQKIPRDFKRLSARFNEIS